MRLGVIFLVLSGTLSLSAQGKKNKRVKYSALPIAYFSPETGVAVGGLVNANFYLQDSAYRPSTILLGGAYTFKNQVLLYLPFELNWGSNKFLVKGELGYYRYFYNYYGIGPEFKNTFELYTVHFPRIRAFGAYRFYGRHYAGLKYNFDDYNIQEIEAGGLLARSEVEGNQGSLVSLAGILHIFDSRDYNFSATKGWFITTSLDHNGAVFGSDFTFSRITSDIIRYLPLGGENILALNLYGGTTFGEAPFQELLLMGGPSKARGYFLGHYRDNALVLLQAEYRFQIWNRLGAVMFSSIGNVGQRLDKVALKTAKWNAGLGLRYIINTDDRLNVRVDYAIGRQTSGLYITVGEAF